MSTTATVPLPVALTEPVEWSSIHKKHLKRQLDKTEIKYNPLTQVHENAEGMPRFDSDSESFTFDISGHADADNASPPSSDYWFDL